MHYLFVKYDNDDDNDNDCFFWHGWLNKRLLSLFPA